MFILFDWRFYRICGGKCYERHVTYVTVRKLTIVNRVGISKRKRQMSSELFGTFHLNSAKGPLGHTQSSPVQNKTHYTRWKELRSANDICLLLSEILILWEEVIGIGTQDSWDKISHLHRIFFYDNPLLNRHFLLGRGIVSITTFCTTSLERSTSVGSRATADGTPNTRNAPCHVTMSHLHPHIFQAVLSSCPQNSIYCQILMGTNPYGTVLKITFIKIT